MSERAPAERFGFERLQRAAGGPMDALCALAARIATHELPVLLTGEPGTGKELLARAIHHLGPRGGRAFEVQSCGALPDELLEAELFGYRRGAFPAALEDAPGRAQQAAGGTLFLDEIGDTSAAFQLELLRAIEHGEARPVGSSRALAIDVRVIAASGRDLLAEVRAGRFREDLYWLLAGLTLHLPPLRERPGDVPPIAGWLLERGGAVRGLRRPAAGGPRRFSAEAMACLMAYRWPGNVRELGAEVTRALALAEGEVLGAELLSPRVLRAAAGEPQERDLELLGGLEGSLKERLDKLEAALVKETLIRHRWNKTRAAAELGLSRVGLRAKLVRYHLDRR